MGIFAGIDCGTQGTKVLIIDTCSQRVLGTGQASHDLISEANGRREQKPEWWTDALISAFKQAVEQAEIQATDIAGIAISGQQHGLVALDAEGRVLRPAKLWCDTETAPENELLLQQLGGEAGSLQTLGLVVATGYTASKLVWMKAHCPELWQQLHRVLLPHDYLNFWLTGNAVAEYGDASGTGLFDVRSRTWNKQVVDLIDDSGRLWNALPPLVEAWQTAGRVTDHAAQLLGVKVGTLVASGGGDNMMSAIGTGNIEPGVVTMSLGTSGTLFSCMSQPIENAAVQIAGFCSSTDRWLPLICTMNVTSATTSVQHLLHQDIQSFNQALAAAPVGAQGVTMLPFFNGERVPALPMARASLHGLDNSNFTQDNLCRAVVEGATYGLRYGLQKLQEAGLQPREIRLTGGGAKSAVWRQIVADVMNCPVVCPVEGEAAALGAAIQAAWCFSQQSSLPGDESIQTVLAQLCEQFVALEESTRTQPDMQRSVEYQTLYQSYLALLRQQYPQVSL